MVEIPTPKPYIFMIRVTRQIKCLINIYGLGVGISTIKEFTSGRGWGMTPRGLSYKAFNLPSHPDHKVIPHPLSGTYFGLHLVTYPFFFRYVVNLWINI
jgi:hypothetical protein